MPTSQAPNRRAHQRFRLPAMYTVVTARRGTAASRDAKLCGHIYDISEGGARIELDEPLEPGESIAVEMELPGAARDVRAQGCVVWVHDREDDPGPRRMAVRFTGFVKRSDHTRLVQYLASGQVRRAA